MIERGSKIFKKGLTGSRTKCPRGEPPHLTCQTRKKGWGGDLGEVAPPREMLKLVLRVPLQHLSLS